MSKLTGFIYQIVPALIIALGSMVVTYIAEISKNLQILTISVQELNLRMAETYIKLNDHETRIRTVEKNNNKPWR